MATIQVIKTDATTFEVSVQDASLTQHVVTVNADYAQGLTQGKHSTEHLIARSFEFLLAREPNTSILRQFELPLIARYFPEYERVIKTSLA